MHRRRGSAPSPLLNPSDHQPQSDSHPIAKRPPDTSHQLQSDSHPITKLLPALVTQALTKLPDSAPLFLEALQSADNLDESDLGCWDSRPPFVPQRVIADERSEARFTERLVEVMHGRRLRQQRERDKMRVMENHGKYVAEVVGALHREISQGVQEWQSLSAFIQDYNAGPRERRMADHYVEWCARKVWHLHSLVEVYMSQKRGA
jgi:hypothetical protein